MNASLVKAFLEQAQVGGEPAHVAAAAATLDAVLKATAERFSRLPLEAEPSGFQAEQRRAAP
jgi:hypothetical protein